MPTHQILAKVAPRICSMELHVVVVLTLLMALLRTRAPGYPRVGRATMAKSVHGGVDANAEGCGLKDGVEARHSLRPRCRCATECSRYVLVGMYSVATQATTRRRKPYHTHRHPPNPALSSSACFSTLASQDTRVPCTSSTARPTPHGKHRPPAPMMAA